MERASKGMLDQATRGERKMKVGFFVPQVKESFIAPGVEWNFHVAQNRVM